MAYELNEAVVSDRAPVVVSDAASLMEALASATGGETILLEGGEYGGLGLWSGTAPWARFPAEVTIASADPADPAVFSGLYLREVENLTLKGLVFDYVAEAGDAVDETPFLVRDSSGVRILSSVFDGDLVDGFGTAHGFTATNVDGLEFSGNELFDWKRGAVFTGSDNLTVSDNDVHSIRSDGMDFADVRDVLIEGNWIHDFVVSDASGDHQDMIQFWTNGTWHATERVVITGNLLDSGAGGASHGIFMRNELVDSGKAGTEMFYKDIVITDNVIRNAHIHGLRVGETEGLTVSNNTLLHTLTPAGEGAIGSPRILLSTGSTDVTVTGNLSHGLTAKGADWIVENNHTIQRTDAESANYYGDLFYNALSDDAVGPEELAFLPGVREALNGAGADMSLFFEEPGALTAQAAAAAVFGDRDARLFDASNTIAGDTDLTGATYAWDFGDGTVAEGIKAQHAFDAYGDHDVTLRVTAADGAVDETVIRVTISDPAGLALEAGADGFLDCGAGAAKAKTAMAAEMDDQGIWGVRIDADHQSVSYGRGHGAVYGVDEFTISMTLRSDSPEAAGELFRIHGSMMASVNKDGGVSFNFTDRDGVRHDVSFESGATLDGGWHRLDIRYDAAGAGLQLLLDDHVMATASATGTTQLSSYWGLDIGSAWGRDGFEGVIGEFATSGEAIGDEAVALRFEAWDALPNVFAPLEGGMALLRAEPAPTLDAVFLFEGEMRVGDAPALVGDAAFGADELVFDGAGDAANLGRFGQIEEAGAFSVLLDLHRDAPATDEDRLLWNHMRFGVIASGDKVAVRINTVEKGFTTALSFDAGLNDGESHRVGVFVDEDADVLQLFVDGAMVGERTDLDLLVNGDGRQYGWVAGGVYGRDFEGGVEALAIGEGQFDDSFMLGHAGDALFA